VDLVAVLGMPVIAYALAQVTVSMWEGLDSASLADAGVALEDGLTLLAAAVGAIIAAYLALTGYAMLLGAAWRGGRAIPKALASLAPHGWTRVTATALGLSMTAGLAVPALATEGGTTQVPSAGWVAAPVSVGVDAAPAALSVGWVEAEAAASPTNAQPSGATAKIAPSDAAPIGAALIGAVLIGAATPPSSAYVVQPGDSLWRITEALLGADASVAQVAESWPALYEANRDSIGDNPSLIQPGLALTIPEGLGA
jgi:hypothetical protein